MQKGLNDKSYTQKSFGETNLERTIQIGPGSPKVLNKLALK